MGRGTLCEVLRWVAWLGSAANLLTASAEQHTLDRQSIQSEEGLASCGILLSHIFPCKNHKALNPVMQYMTSALVRHDGGVL